MTVNTTKQSRFNLYSAATLYNFEIEMFMIIMQVESRTNIYL